MNVVYAFLARSAEVSANGLFSALSADFDTLTVPTLPTRLLPLFVVVRLSMVRADETEHTIRVELRDSAGERRNDEILVSFHSTVKNPERDNRLVLALPLVGVPVAPGEHSCHVIVDEEEMYKFALHIDVAESSAS